MMHIGGLACNLSCIVMPTATRVGHFPNRPFLSIIAFAATRPPCPLVKLCQPYVAKSDYVSSALLIVLTDTRAPVPVKGRFLSEREYGLSHRFVVQRDARTVAVVAHRSVRIDAEAACRRHRIHIRAEKEKLPAVSFLLPLNEPLEFRIAVAVTRIFLPVRGDHKKGVRRSPILACPTVQLTDVPYCTADCV